MFNCKAYYSITWIYSVSNYSCLLQCSGDQSFSSSCIVIVDLKKTLRKYKIHFTGSYSVIDVGRKTRGWSGKNLHARTGESDGRNFSYKHILVV